jgi:hypothetical protein
LPLGSLDQIGVGASIPSHSGHRWLLKCSAPLKSDHRNGDLL